MTQENTAVGSDYWCSNAGGRSVRRINAVSSRAAAEEYAKTYGWVAWGLAYSILARVTVRVWQGHLWREDAELHEVDLVREG